MWPFSRRGCRAGTPAPHPTEIPQLDDFRESDATLKLWLPQRLVDRINWLSVKLNASRPDIVRGLIFEHLYGRAAYVALVSFSDATAAENERRARVGRTSMATDPTGSPPIDQALHGRVEALEVDDRPMSDPGAGWIRASRDRQTVADLAHLGKSDEDLTLALPSRMKRDVQELASKHHLDASSYVRKLLVLELLGAQIHTDWQQAVGAITAEVQRLEKG